MTDAASRGPRTGGCSIATRCLSGPQARPRGSSDRNLRDPGLQHGTEPGFLDSHEPFAKTCRLWIAVAFVTQSSLGRDCVRRIGINNRNAGCPEPVLGTCLSNRRLLSASTWEITYLVSRPHYGDLATMIQPERGTRPLSFRVTPEPSARPLFARKPIFSYRQVPLIL